MMNNPSNDNIRYVDIDEAELAMEKTDQVFMDLVGRKPEPMEIHIENLQTKRQINDFVEMLKGSWG